MQAWGRTGAGIPRFRCPVCAVSATRQRPDQTERAWRAAFVAWLVGGGSQEGIAYQCEITSRALRHRFARFWNQPPQPCPRATGLRGLILDGTTVMAHQRVVLVAQDVRRYPVTWAFTDRESYASWLALLQDLDTQGIVPRFVVCDGQKGLLKALRTVWPLMMIQRCLIHVVRQARLWLTQHPKTPAGQHLLRLVRQLTAIRTKRQRRRWIRAYRHWLRRSDAFLKERTQHPTQPKRWWYAHRKLRAVRSLISNSLNDLFRYTRYPEIPRTTNHVEGGINSRIKDLYRRHRGMSIEHKTVLTAHYLSSRQTPQKPTRRFL